jgi:hypothetical protein
VGYGGWGAARTAALEGAEAVTKLIEELPPAALEDAILTGRDRLIDRSPHWNAHLDEIGPPSAGEGRRPPLLGSSGRFTIRTFSA